MRFLWVDGNDLSAMGERKVDDVDERRPMLLIGGKKECACGELDSGGGCIL